MTKGRDAFAKKYAEVIMGMFLETGDDIYTCVDKIVYMTEHRNEPGADFYAGIPEDFDYAQCQVDIDEILRG